MDPSTTSLSHQVFGPSRRIADGRVKSQAEGIIERLPLYHWPVKGVTDSVKLSVLSYLTAYGKSDDESPSAWATWSLSYVVLCFPELQAVINQTNGREYHFQPLPMTFIDQITALCEQGEEEESEVGDSYRALLKATIDPPHFPSILHDSTFMPPDLAACQTVPALYGYAALLIFLSGKKINQRNVVSITERRPSNIINAFNIGELAAFVLTGEGRMGTTAHNQVNQAWVTHSAARQAVISEVAAFAAGATLPQRVVYTVSKLLEYSGMQPAYFIHRFLQAMPEAMTYSCIRPALNAYISSVREVASAPAYLQPYYKLIHGDSTRAFHRNSILVLASCAIAYEKYTSPSMVNFVLGEGATAAVNMYDAEAIRKGHQTLQNLTFKDEGEDAVE